VEPALGVLVPVAHDGDGLVDDHELDVARALAAGARDGLSLVLGDVPVVVQVFAGRGGKGGVEVVGYEFVVAALGGEEFALRYVEGVG